MINTFLLFATFDACEQTYPWIMFIKNMKRSSQLNKNVLKEWFPLFSIQRANLEPQAVSISLIMALIMYRYHFTYATYNENNCRETEFLCVMRVWVFFFKLPQFPLLFFISFFPCQERNLHWDRCLPSQVIKL